MARVCPGLPLRDDNTVHLNLIVFKIVYNQFSNFCDDNKNNATKGAQGTFSLGFSFCGDEDLL